MTHIYTYHKSRPGEMEMKDIKFFQEPNYSHHCLVGGGDSDSLHQLNHYYQHRHHQETTANRNHNHHNQNRDKINKLEERIITNHHHNQTVRGVAESRDENVFHEQILIDSTVAKTSITAATKAPFANNTALPIPCYNYTHRYYHDMTHKYNSYNDHYYNYFKNYCQQYDASYAF